MKKIGLLSLLMGGFLNVAYSLPWDESKVYEFPTNNLKHYATVAFRSQDKYLFAGTVFDYNGNQGDNAIHWMHVDNTGTGTYTFSKVVNDPDADERLVGAHLSANEDENILVASFASLSPNGADGVEILRIDATTGNLTGNSTKIYSTSSTYPYLYPTNSLLTGDILYICGFMATDRNPDLTTSKEGFVIRYDLSMKMVTNRYSYNAPSTVTSYDYDIAKAMRVIQDVSGTDVLWVGGSVNDGPMQNLTLDLATISIANAQPFGNMYPTSWNNYSYDITKDPVTNEFYIFGNRSTINNNQPFYGNMHVTVVSPSLTPYTGLGIQSQAYIDQMDYISGVNVIPEIQPNTPFSVILMGYQSNVIYSTQCPPITGYNLPTLSNINPYLTKLELSSAGGNIIVNQVWWNTYTTMFGTGAWGNPSSFADLGGAKSNIYTAPLNLVRATGSNDLVLNAPVWDRNTNTLTFKWLRTDVSGQFTTCKWFSNCILPVDLIETYLGLPVTHSSFTTTDNFPSFNSDEFRPDNEFNCGRLYRTAPAEISEIAKGTLVKASLYPNPAQDMVSLKLDGSVDNNATITASINDMVGRNIGALFTGKVGNIPKSIKLPMIAPGIYTVTISIDNTKINSIPLSIQN